MANPGYASRVRHRNGMALISAIVAVVVIGTIAAAAVFVGSQEYRSAESVRRIVKASAIAEGGVAEIFRGWTPLTTNSMRLFPLDSLVASPTASPNSTGYYDAIVYKLTPELYFLDVIGNDALSYTGGASAGAARGRVGMIARVVPLDVSVKAAMTVGGKVVFGGGNVFVAGADHIPPSWTSCPPLDTAVAGVSAKNAGDVGNSAGQVTGNPPVLIDPTIDSTTFLQYGSTNYATLAALANITLPTGDYSIAPTSSNGVCTASNTNWGDGATPSNPCGGRFPIIHITGNATLQFGQGQGILLVDGNLTFAGTFTFYGIVITRGSFNTVSGGNPKLYGTIMSADMNLATTAFSGDAVINYSKCALLKARNATANPAILRSRSWVELM